ncbi:unnamed protein product [Mytilus edulis]|uniref:Exonuclease domain-containing protein n=1 Tax=Mytilus edulis TaxID=6550 RepID=A0A8S3U6H9_MYTED|nr:unnamed protein product [Mytilus edulis]
MLNETQQLTNEPINRSTLANVKLYIQVSYSITAMIDALGGPQRVNNVLSTLNLPPISHKNLKVMERRAGEMIEGFANLSMDQRCREAFEAEKSNAAEDENGTENMLDTNTDSHTDMTDTNSNNSLPYKAPLSDPVLREKLQNLFEPVISKAASYADLGSSQACEHANRAASLRAPKHLHYGESESLDFRVKASAACINEGRNYLSETFKRHGLSPGSFTVPYNSKKDHEREKRQKKSKLPEQKLRRLKLKEERITSKGACEATEGASYESEISFSEQAEDIERIPDAIPKPLFTAVSSLDNPTFVIIDLETTDLIRRNIIPHIVQIAAKEHRTQTSFNRYIPPQLPMSNEAEKIVMGFIDSLALFRSNFPKIEKYNQPFLAQHFCKEEYNAHNAVDDVNMLDKILIAANVSKELLLKLCYNSNSHLLQENFIKAKAKNLLSFHPLIASGVMKMTTAENIAGSGLNCAHLKLIYTRKGEDGLIDVLMSKNAFGKPRVSNDKKLMCSVVQKMGNMFSEL